MPSNKKYDFFEDNVAPEFKIRDASPVRIFAPDDAHNFTGFFAGIDLSVFRKKLPVIIK
jgi:hypothetical protein